MPKVGSNQEIGAYCAVFIVTLAIFGAIMLRG